MYGVIVTARRLKIHLVLAGEQGEVRLNVPLVWVGANYMPPDK